MVNFLLLGNTDSALALDIAKKAVFGFPASPEQSPGKLSMALLNTESDKLIMKQAKFATFDEVTGQLMISPDIVTIFDPAVHGEIQAVIVLVELDSFVLKSKQVFQARKFVERVAESRAFDKLKIIVLLTKSAVFEAESITMQVDLGHYLTEHVDKSRGLLIVHPQTEFTMDRVFSLVSENVALHQSLEASGLLY